MSSPLMDEIRERRGLVYYAACSTDISDLAGQFVVEASMAPENVETFGTELVRLLRAQAGAIDAVGLERARNQIAVRRLHVQERPYRRLEEAALDVFALGRVRSHAERLERLMAVTGAQLQAEFARMLERTGVHRHRRPRPRLGAGAPEGAAGARRGRRSDRGRSARGLTPSDQERAGFLGGVPRLTASALPPAGSLR